MCGGGEPCHTYHTTGYPTHGKAGEGGEGVGTGNEGGRKKGGGGG